MLKVDRTHFNIIHRMPQKPSRKINHHPLTNYLWITKTTYKLNLQINLEISHNFLAADADNSLTRAYTRTRQRQVLKRTTNEENRGIDPSKFTNRHAEYANMAASM